MIENQREEYRLTASSLINILQTLPPDTLIVRSLENEDTHLSFTRFIGLELETVYLGGPSKCETYRTPFEGGEERKGLVIS